MNHIPPVWVLLDDKPGHANQALGVAEALGVPFVTKQLEYNKLSVLPQRVLKAGVWSLTAACRASLMQPWPEIVIAAGRRSVPVARYIKQQAAKHHEHCRHVQLMWPGDPCGDMDLIATPQHDAAKITATHKNVLLTLGAPHRLTQQRLLQQAIAWRDAMPAGSRPKIAVMIGGNAKSIRYKRAHWKQFFSQLYDIATGADAELIITTSRRTGAKVERLIHSFMQQGVLCQLLPWTQDPQHNPYPAMLALCDAMIVTGDSVSMCSEACSIGKPVFIFAPQGVYPEKHSIFHQQLFQGGYARLMERPQVKAMVEIILHSTEHSPPRLNVAAEIATSIRQL